MISTNYTFVYKSVLCFLIAILCCPPSFAKVAKVVLFKGEVKAKAAKEQQLKSLQKDDWLEEGDIVQTGEKSFVKLVFSDQSQINLGPSSKMVISKFSQGKEKEPGLITLLNGQVRAKVAKDYLKAAEDQGSSKLFVKTKTAAMGVRGTDFQVIFNGENNVTSLVTFTGEVAMNRITPNMGNLNEPRQLDKLVSSETAVSVTKGQFSGANPNQERPTLPVKISPAQFNVLEKNDVMAEATVTEKKSFQSPIPPGVSSKAFTNTEGNEALQGQLAQAVGGGEALKEVVAVSQKELAKDEVATTVAKDAPPPEGSYDSKTGAFAPPAGGFVDMKTGLYVSPPPGSQFDKDKGVYIPPPTVGGVDPATGSFLPPAGFKLNTDGTFTEKATPKIAETQSKGPDAKKGNEAGAGSSDNKPKAKDEKKVATTETGKPKPPPPPPQTALMVKPGELPFVPPNAPVIVNNKTGETVIAGVPAANNNPLNPTGPVTDPNALNALTAIVDQKVSTVVQQVVDNLQTALNNSATVTNVKIFINIIQ